MIGIDIDLAAYRRNLSVLRARIAPADLMAVVKSNAYGHGLVPVARAATDAGIRLLGVLDAASGIALRDAGIGQDVRLFTWLFGPGEDYRPLIDADIDLGISHRHELDRIAATGAGRPATIHLKLDTGLHRNGASEADWPALIRRAVELERTGAIHLHGVWTHIGEASDDDDTTAIERFELGITIAEALGARFRLRHLAASAAGFARADARFDAARIGAFSYGIAPGNGIGPADIGIEPVMTFSADVSEVRDVGGARSATVAAGFLDGIPANAAGSGVAVTIRGRRHPIVAVTASSTTVQLVGDVALGDIAVFFGAGSDGSATLQEWADALGTIGEEIAVRVPARLPRRYL